MTTHPAAPSSTAPSATAPSAAARSRVRALPTTHPTRRALAAVVPALHSEWIKATTIRSTRWLLALTLVGGVAVSWAVAALVTGKPLTVSEVGFYWSTITSALAAITGTLLITTEIQHGTLAAAITARPTRWVTALAKTVTAAATGLVLGGLGLAAGFSGAALGGLPLGDTAALGSTIGWALLFTTLSGVLGLGVGMIVRHSAAAVAGFLIWGFVVENILHVALPAEVARFVPFIAGNHLLGYNPDFETPHAIAIALSQSQNALVFTAWTALAVIAGTVLLQRRDVP